MAEEEDNPPMSPRTAMLFTTMEARFAAMQAQLEQMNRRHDGGSSDEDGGPRRRYRRGRREEDRNEGGGGLRGREERLEGVKVKIPSFVGLNNPEAYLEWELKMDQIFDCHHYNVDKKVKMAALEFKEYAMVWWDQYQQDRRRVGGVMIETWEEMKLVMRRRFVHSSNQRGLHNKLQRLTQGSKTVDEYFKAMENCH
ncbi:hypothetical protein Lal_00049289, partial [Lupinus albus]